MERSGSVTMGQSNGFGQTPYGGLPSGIGTNSPTKTPNLYLSVRYARGLAGKPLAGFCTTPSRRITVVYGVIAYVIRFETPSLHR